MTASELVKLAAAQVEAFCKQRVPPEVRDRVLLVFTVRGKAITIVERRRPWRPDLPDWTSQKIAQFRYDDAKSVLDRGSRRSRLVGGSGEAS